MISIGLRASPQAVHYAVVVREGDAQLVREVSAVVVPAALQAPEQLAFIRTTLLDIMAEYRADCAGIRTTEPIARPNSLRLNIEGVIQELIASGAVATHFAGPIAKMAGLLKIVPRSRVKKLVNGEEHYPGTTNWAKYSAEQREALLAAVAAMEVRAPRFVPLLANAEAPEA